MIMECIPKQEPPELCTKEAFVESELVNLHQTNSFDIKMQYPMLGLKNAVRECLVRKEVYERLCIAKSYLPLGINLRIYDAWRPFKLQQELYDMYANDVIEMFDLHNESEEEKRRIVGQYVSIPDKRMAPVHTTGGAVDVTLVDSFGCELDMGTTFDHFGVRSNTAYFENTDDEVVKKNRRILYNAMKKAGFTNLPSEWWHYDYGDRFWAFYTQNAIMYEGIYEIGENLYGERKEK